MHCAELEQTIEETKQRARNVTVGCVMWFCVLCLQKKAKLQEVFAAICERLNLRETEFFGLARLVGKLTLAPAPQTFAKNSSFSSCFGASTCTRFASIVLRASGAFLEELIRVRSEWRQTRCLIASFLAGFQKQPLAALVLLSTGNSWERRRRTAPLLWRSTSFEARWLSSL